MLSEPLKWCGALGLQHQWSGDKVATQLSALNFHVQVHIFPLFQPHSFSFSSESEKSHCSPLLWIAKRSLSFFSPMTSLFFPLIQKLFNIERMPLKKPKNPIKQVNISNEILTVLLLPKGFKRILPTRITFAASSALHLCSLFHTYLNIRSALL